VGRLKLTQVRAPLVPAPPRWDLGVFRLFRGYPQAGPGSLPTPPYNPSGPEFDAQVCRTFWARFQGRAEGRKEMPPTDGKAVPRMFASSGRRDRGVGGLIRLERLSPAAAGGPSKLHQWGGLAIRGYPGHAVGSCPKRWTSS